MEEEVALEDIPVTVETVRIVWDLAAQTALVAEAAVAAAPYKAEIMALVVEAVLDSLVKAPAEQKALPVHLLAELAVVDQAVQVEQTEIT